jgi:periplasmic protein TonB
MSTASYPFYFDRCDSLKGTLWLSVALHVTFFALIGFYSMLGPRMGSRWGQPGMGAGNSVQVKAVSSLPSVPLPSPMLATRNALATQNPGLHQTLPIPKPTPIPEAEQIPRFKDTVRPEKAERVNKRIQHELAQALDNAVPFGLGGQPVPSSVQFTAQGGEGGLSFGEGNFKDRYGWYVQAVKNRISNNWLISTISPSLTAAPRVYVTFNILRDGTITDVQVQQSSGVPEVDRSGLRAVLASSPLAPLPPDYPGNRISVKFFFDFHR